MIFFKRSHLEFTDRMDLREKQRIKVHVWKENPKHLVTEKGIIFESLLAKNYRKVIFISFFTRRSTLRQYGKNDIGTYLLDFTIRCDTLTLRRRSVTVQTLTHAFIFRKRTKRTQTRETALGMILTARVVPSGDDS